MDLAISIEGTVEEGEEEEREREEIRERRVGETLVERRREVGKRRAIFFLLLLDLKSQKTENENKKRKGNTKGALLSTTKGVKLHE